MSWPAVDAPPSCPPPPPTSFKELPKRRAANRPEDAHALGTNRHGGQVLTSVDGFPALISDPWLNGAFTTLHACSDLWASGARVTTAQAIVTVPAVDSEEQVYLLSQTLAGVRSALNEQRASLIGGHNPEANKLACSNRSAVEPERDRRHPTGQKSWRKGGSNPMINCC